MENEYKQLQQSSIHKGSKMTLDTSDSLQRDKDSMKFPEGK